MEGVVDGRLCFVMVVVDLDFFLYPRQTLHQAHGVVTNGEGQKQKQGSRAEPGSTQTRTCLRAAWCCWGKRVVCAISPRSQETKFHIWHILDREKLRVATQHN